ncbi:MAG: hypothetical protein D6722_03550 [Bacteroidetes bacterium]|nr:MAG: hypothetical protein D6722_03550 [Bacteroidota bacterium]
MIGLGLMGLTACQGSAYERTLARELASGERYDSLFLGIHFGMSARDFYGHCWKLNQDSLIRQGPNNLSVQYIFEEGFRDRMFMNFYPNFTNDTARIIWEMPVLFSYEAWAIWSKEYWSDSLLPEVLDLFDDWYGGEFIKIEHPDKGVAYVKVQGNRRVIVRRQDDQYVKAVITDMLAKDTVPARPAPSPVGAIPSFQNPNAK